jgi:dienelactone hydrolase
METIIKIPTTDGHTIYGTLNSTTKKDKLIIFVHGLAGSQYEHHYFNAPSFFNKAFDTFRFDFYPSEYPGRSLSECSITSHAKDLQTVIKHFAKKYKNIFLVGHSMGCATILQTNIDTVTKIVLWEPPKGMKTLKEERCAYIPSLNKYILSVGMDILISKEMVDEWKKLCDTKKQMMNNITVPCKFIFAGNSTNWNVWKPFVEDTKHTHIIIAGASHCFYEEGTEQLLFKETLSFLK